MKQVKFFLVALMAAVMGVSVSSCIKGEDNNIYSNPGAFVEVVHEVPISFKDPYTGIKLIPIAEQRILSADADIALISYQFDRTTVTDGKSVTITLTSNPYYVTKSYVSSSSSVVANAPVMTLEPITNFGMVRGGFFDKNTLILPIAYKYKKYEKDSDNATEARRHTFALAYDAETGFKSGVLTLRLRHHAEEIPGSGEETTVKREDSTFDYKAFDISRVLTGLSSTPTKISVVIDQNQSDDEFNNIKDATFQYDYSFTEQN